MQGYRDAGINSLIDRLEEAHLRNQIERLAIVAHGQPGSVFMSGQQRRPAAAQQFRDLSTFLQRGGMLSFIPCNAGAGTSGDMFLTDLSRQLPDRVIVGYDIYGFFEILRERSGNGSGGEKSATAQAGHTHAGSVGKSREMGPQQEVSFDCRLTSRRAIMASIARIGVAQVIRVSFTAVNTRLGGRTKRC